MAALQKSIIQGSKIFIQSNKILLKLITWFEGRPEMISTFLLIMAPILTLQANLKLSDNLSLLNIILSIAPLIYVNLIFYKVSKSLKIFSFRVIYPKFTNYFKQKFIKSIQHHNIFKDLCIPHRRQTWYLEIMLYIGQILKTIQKDVVSVSRTMWPFLFYPNLFSTFLLMFWRLIVQLDYHNSLWVVGDGVNFLVVSR